MEGKFRGSAFSIEKIAAFLLAAVLFFYILIKIKFILAPLIFAVFIALLLLPLQRRLERKIKKRGLSTVIVMTVVIAAIAGLLTFFSIQLVEVFQNIPTISGKLKAGFDQIFTWANEQFGLNKNDGIVWVKENFSKLLDAPLSFLSKGVSSSTQFLVDGFLALIAVFYFLAYKDPIKKVILLQFSTENRQKGARLLVEIQQAVSKYLSGLLIVILILAVLNSLGLWLIGVGYPIFFGVIAAVMVIIPYFGTTIGGLIPFLYSAATFDYWWQPLAVIGMYAGIQQIEGNFITPNIVGSSVRINFFVAFVALFVGGFIWGLAGIVLSLPLAAIIKIICDAVDILKPVGFLMSNEILDRKGKFENEWDEDRFRISTIFKNRNSS
jgi:predicted PurR-regulated permease PerM